MTFGDSTTFETFVLREAATHRTFEFELALANPFKKYIYVRSIEEQLCTDMDTDSASENDRVEETENQVNGEETQDSEMTMTQDDDAHNNQGNGYQQQNGQHDAQVRDLSLTGQVGFDSLPDQLVNKSVAKGFAFNILCVGETGLGKSTLMDTLFNTRFENAPASHHLPGVNLDSSTYELQESNVKLKLTVVNTVGFGDQINKEESYKPIVDHIDQQFENYLQEELKIKRSIQTYHDTRIHTCLYFVAPTGHSLKSLDLVTMKKLDSKVNIVPVIAKADTISKSELHKFKIKIMSELVANGVQIYQFPTDDETVSDLNSTMNGHLPFAVVGSTEEVKMGNKMVRARQYPWGVVQVENENHCDFVKLREMLVRTNMEDLIEQTHTRHYELYRRCKLEEMGFVDNSPDNKPLSLQETYAVKRQEHQSSLQKKEDEMRQLFVLKVKDKEGQLKTMEKDLHEKFDKLKKDHAEEKKRLDDEKRRLDDEMDQFNQKRKQFNEEMATLPGKNKKK